jgi:type IX secretion system PorP/SprF family membrane protein
MKRIILLLGIQFALSISIQAQDARFAQFYNSPMQVNPAMAGVTPGSARVALNYRDLYYSLLGNKPFRTIAVSYDQRFRAVNRDYFAVSGSFLRDQAGLPDYYKLQGNVGGSYLKQINGGRYASSEQYLVAGAQFGFAQQTLNWSELTFSAQFDGNGVFFDPNAPTGEPFSGLASNVYLDFNAGILWYAVFDDKKSVYLGGAMHHLNEPSATFTGDESVRVYRRYNINAGGEWPLGEVVSLLPAALFMSQGPMLSTTLGTNMRYTNNKWDELALRLGLWTHFNNRTQKGIGMDAIIVSAIFEMEKWNLGFSYDITSSRLSASNYYRGAFEMSLVLLRPGKEKKSLVCPKF